MSVRSHSTSSSSSRAGRKRSWECPYCSNTYQDDFKSLQCDSCENWVCLPCSKVPDEMYNLMNKLSDKKSAETNVKGLKWICKMCDKSLPTLKEMNTTLGSIMKTNNERFDAIEEQVKRVEGSIGEKVSEEVSTLKVKFMAEISEEIDKKMVEKSKEESDRKYREMNLCFFNIPVSSDPEPAVRKQHDKDIVCRLFKVITKSENDPQIKNIFRLRPASRNLAAESQPVVKVTFSEKSDIRRFLTNARYIKGNPNLESELQKIIVSRDMPVREREENRRLRKELQEKNKDGKHFTIRNGTIVPIQNPGVVTGVTPSC